MVETQFIRVRYWAAAKSAAGTASDDLPVNGSVKLSEIHAEVVRRHPDTNLASVLAVCSTLVGDQPVGTSDPASVQVAPGSTVEFLPPFAGG